MQYHISEWIIEITWTISNLKDAGVMIHSLSLFKLPVWPMQKLDGSMTGLLLMSSKSDSHCSFPPDVYLYRSKSTQPVTCGMQLLMWQINFSPLARHIWSNWISPGRDINTPLLSYLRACPQGLELISQRISCWSTTLMTLWLHLWIGSTRH